MHISDQKERNQMPSDGEISSASPSEAHRANKFWSIIKNLHHPGKGQEKVLGEFLVASTFYRCEEDEDKRNN